ncbi:SDR family oxidoreductase [Vibrio coralliilyticus]|uniref:SDR family oxidoreductase n=1 Tax=Vibrio coralliilyticus TaxID=190893 RepID=UPI001E63ECA8|nr:NAD(P)-dependent oxidoreductase [Vibrio coralliilyticus]MCC2524561.1 NAD(P)-dependent oxidoreductase [Vibrio coralliilyticus]
MRFGVTGSTGMLGTELLKAISTAGYDAVGLRRSELSHETSLEDTVIFLRAMNINVLIHCAANTNVELCEKEPSSCWIENCLFSEILATAAEKLNIKIVFISSTGIYGDWKDSAYIEYDKVLPTTVHHESKYNAENFIKSHNRDYLIIRTGWLFGGNWHSSKNFVANRIKEAKACDGKIYSNATQIGNPTYAKDVAEIIVELSTAGHIGVFNCVGDSAASRYEYVAEIVKIAQLSVEVLPAQKSSFNRVAKVSDNESAENFKLRALGLSSERPWQDGLKQYILANREKF